MPSVSRVAFLLQFVTVFVAFPILLISGNVTHGVERIVCYIVGTTFLIIGVGLISGPGEQTYGGRFIENASEKLVPSNSGWMIMESPSFAIPFVIVLFFTQSIFDQSIGNKVALGGFMLHYFHRSFIYASLHRGSPMPFATVFGSFIFTTSNGLAQGISLGRLDHVDVNIRFWVGLVIFLLGMIANIHSDHYLITLRKTDEYGKRVYRIPQGGLFEFISAPNLIGEVVEWAGYAIMCNFSIPALCFAVSSFGVLVSRAKHVHRDYQSRFKSKYPTGRRAVIPGLY
uniref:3-oxo-5-alpha-steroid 4-dehydrogenase C-terminal domain-containing protein n=1 Tax=Mucochytrium quahogii TaxID=96639 RepID=A0A7S2RZE2_9STRA|mmetsp:Transcript_16840/g.27297  ORF Transcript_16840/g.27297 Transcript_16840/m.27297 type:complete len:285 (+) Transcript_16840:152-1006(+)